MLDHEILFKRKMEMHKSVFIPNIQRKHKKMTDSFNNDGQKVSYKENVL